MLFYGLVNIVLVFRSLVGMFVHIMESYFVVIFSYVLAYLMGSSIINIKKNLVHIRLS
ncbi:hypothetical protein DsansV1_C16g0141751 [Dioscorea sansibarensis]